MDNSVLIQGSTLPQSALESGMESSNQDSQWLNSPEAVFEYIYKCCLVISEVEMVDTRKYKFKKNQEMVFEYKSTHPCERCGVRSQNSNDFYFFEMHLNTNKKIRALIYWAEQEQLKKELSTRGMYCRKCYRLIVREVTHNIKAPPVEPFSISF
jgi:hypothetical protein